MDCFREPITSTSRRVTYCLVVPTDAFVARIHDQASGQPVIFLAGILGEGTEAASEVVSNPGYLNAMVQKAPTVIEGHLAPPTVVAVEPW